MRQRHRLLRVHVRYRMRHARKSLDDRGLCQPERRLLHRFNQRAWAQVQQEKPVRFSSSRASKRDSMQAKHARVPAQPCHRFGLALRARNVRGVAVEAQVLERKGVPRGAVGASVDVGVASGGEVAVDAHEVGADLHGLAE
jgi:hypothetical protein